MKKSDKHMWPPPKWLENPIPTTILVHDEEIEVYEGSVSIGNIKLYRENERTTLDLQHLLEGLGLKNVSDLSDAKIIDYILKQGLHRIQELAGSIKKNGIKVPIIITNEKELLDGNRRFLASQYLKKTEKQNYRKYAKIPAYCLQPKISKDIRLKIISEENFLPDYKEAWPREVRAKFAVNLYNEILQECKSKEDAYDQVKYFLDVSKQDIQRFEEVLGMIDEFVNYANRCAAKTKQDAEIFAREKFHFFEEFYNKTCKGRDPITKRELLKEANELLFKCILNGQISSTIRVRELAEIVRYEPVKKYLQGPNASFEIARTNYQDYARPKRAALKIVHFCEWLEDLSNTEVKNISDQLKRRLISAVKKLDNI